RWLRGQPAAVVVLPDADAMLRRPSVEAAEDTLRLWLAAARWTVPAAGADGTGRVVLQTREPTHPAVQALVRWDPEGFWRGETRRRAELRYPPAAVLVALRAPRDQAEAVAAALRGALPAGNEVVGPEPGGGMIVKSDDLRGTLGALTPLRHTWDRSGLGVRIDVDPVPIA
ncbi:MAG TPA: hypothetical protein VG452_09830, partial [Egibacteraceae bacterium]|nr:hypothetical protein [Egibacteraceae bacterium]